MPRPFWSAEARFTVKYRTRDRYRERRSFAVGDFGAATPEAAVRVVYPEARSLEQVGERSLGASKITSFLVVPRHGFLPIPCEVQTW